MPFKKTGLGQHIEFVPVRTATTNVPNEGRDPTPEEAEQLKRLAAERHGKDPDGKDPLEKKGK